MERIFLRVVVLRLGHRKDRDKRISTHCALVARTFGADKIIFSGEFDEGILESVKKLCLKWGGSFKAVYLEDWVGFIKRFKKRGGRVVHLTMYGEPFDAVTKKVADEKSLLIIVGAEKVPREAYAEATFNACVGCQPHSEVAALAVFLYELFGREKLFRNFAGWKRKVIPNARRKVVINNCR